MQIPMTRWPIWMLVALVGLSTAAAGCATNSAHNEQRSYADVAEQRYSQAREDLDDADYIDAIRRFNTVRNKFPYSKYAALADLRIGDAYFEQEKYASAVEQYRSFLQLHPNHPKAGFAHWRVALAFYKLMPEDWWFLPPAYERNLTKSKDAVRELKVFVRRYPDSEYTGRAKRLLGRARRRLADHEMYVAQFYLERDNPRAAAMRLRYLLENYAGLGLDPQALFLLARSYLELGDTPRAKTALTDLIEYHPDDELAEDARDYIAKYDLK